MCREFSASAIERRNRIAHWLSTLPRRRKFSPPLSNFTSLAPLFKVVFIKKFSQNDQAPRRGEIPQ
jgi:hypothetical protein